MTNVDYPVVGDVIMSKHFRFGRNLADSTIEITPGVGKHEVTLPVSVEERLKQFTDSNEFPPEYRVVDQANYDFDRGLASFVVTDAGMSGGSNDSIGRIGYPDGWHVEAIRLNDDDSFNPDGERITFYMSGSFRHIVESVDIVGHMNRVFVWG